MPNYYDRLGRPFQFEEYAEEIGKPNARTEGVWAQRVASSWIGEDIYVSTVHLAINHNFDDEGDPLIFETMVFGLAGDEGLGEIQARYSTESEAIAGHLAHYQAALAAWNEANV